MIEYTKGGKTINCIWGCDNQLPCREFCWARNIAKRFGRQVGNARGYSEATIQRMINFQPVFLPDQLNKISKIKKPSRIFMNWMGETFSKGNFLEGGEPVFEMLEMFYFIKRFPQHQYFFLTKRPDNFMKFYDSYPHLFTPNIWIGVSSMYGETRDWGIKKFPGHKFISIEPLMGDVAQTVDFSIFEWVIIGGFDNVNRYKKYKYIQQKDITEWIRKIVEDIQDLEECNNWHIPIWMKNNLRPFWQGELIQELPRLK